MGYPTIFDDVDRFEATKTVSHAKLQAIYIASSQAAETWALKEPICRNSICLDPIVPSGGGSCAIDLVAYGRTSSIPCDDYNLKEPYNKQKEKFELLLKSLFPANTWSEAIDVLKRNYKNPDLIWSEPKA